MLPRVIHLLHAATLFSLPLCGVGLFKLITGRDAGFGLQPAWVFLALAILLQILWELSQPRGEDLRKTGRLLAMQAPVNLALAKTFLGILGVLGVSALGLVIAASGEPTGVIWSRFFRQVVQLLIMLAFFGWCTLWIRGPVRWRLTLQALAAGCAFQVMYALGQGIHFYLPWDGFQRLEEIFTSNPAILSGSEQLYLDNRMQPVPRLRGTMCEPLYLGNYLLLVWPWLWTRWRGKTATLMTGVLILVMVGTWSRGAWLAALGQGILAGGFLWARGGRPWNTRWIALTLALLLVAVAAVFWVPLSFLDLPRQRLIQAFSTQDWSNLTRLYSMEAAWRAFLLSPLVGIGWGQYAFHFPALVDPMGLQSQFTWPVVNSFPLKVLCETGLLGLAFLVWLVIQQVRGLLRAIRTADPFLTRVLILAGLAAGGVGLQLLTFSQYNLPHIWVASGLLWAACVDPEGLRDALEVTP